MVAPKGLLHFDTRNLDDPWVEPQFLLSSIHRSSPLGGHNNVAETRVFYLPCVSVLCMLHLCLAIKSKFKNCSPQSSKLMLKCGQFTCLLFFFFFSLVCFLINLRRLHGQVSFQADWMVREVDVMSPRNLYTADPAWHVFELHQSTCTPIFFSSKFCSTTSSTVRWTYGRITLIWRDRAFRGLTVSYTQVLDSKEGWCPSPHIVKDQL